MSYQNVYVVVSVRQDSDAHKFLLRRSAIMAKISVGPLELLDKAEVARKMLSTHSKQLEERPFHNQVTTVGMAYQ